MEPNYFRWPHRKLNEKTDLEVLDNLNDTLGCIGYCCNAVIGMSHMWIIRHILKHCSKFRFLLKSFLSLVNS